MIVSTVREHTLGRMVVSISASGQMENRTVLAFTDMRTVKKEKADGRKAKELPGWTRNKRESSFEKLRN